MNRLTAPAPAAPPAANRGGQAGTSPPSLPAPGVVLDLLPTVAGALRGEGAVVVGVAPALLGAGKRNPLVQISDSTHAGRNQCLAGRSKSPGSLSAS